ncbi:2'-5' RNA ligase family protein [Cellulomonas sp. zg-ZUI199]|uniref:2'-5' RNA ligase family protein n=1 Tax=Cellulomonas wangleii TaxID=2816956 RepID=A0ABX8D7Y9_9CELL|nr:2'-5' RNA ligase family protein [Cellulomonas wangleii]MBO0926006.1 2'-5' RNA ligase family protein [Cellulomonas wangleii]QVI63301.1 2'-5' RNA ligase family protein [Cellulomonas wangleii]
MRLPRAAAGETVVGVAIAVPEPFRTQLHDARVRFGDPEARNIVPHVTLVGPTPVADDRLAALDEHLAATAARHHPFRIRLHGTQTFRPVSPVVFVALVEGASQCAGLESALRVGSLQVATQFPYHPHVTVAHDLDDAALDAAQAAMVDYDAAFDVTGIHRFVHDGTGWCPVRRFALGAVTGAPDAPGAAHP